MSNALRRFMSVFGSSILVAGLIVIAAQPSQAGGNIITVTTTNDDALADPNSNDCSLREAIESANTDTAIDDCVTGLNTDTINLGNGETYLLTATTAAPLTITESVNINGNNSVIQQQFADRVVTITAGIVDFDQIQLVGAGSPCTCNGAIVNVAVGSTLGLVESSMRQGKAGVANGGGIYNSGTVTITDSAIGGMGGNENTSGMYPSPGGGGNIYNNGGMLTIRGSLLQGGNAIVDGGGIHNAAGGDITIVNSTLSQNVAGENGGGIFNSNDAGNSILAYGTTITENRGDYTGSGAPSGTGGGIFSAGGTVTLDGTILAGNVDESGSITPAHDCSGAVNSADYNLIGKTDNCSYSSQSGDVQGTIAVPAEPLLSGPFSNGGPTLNYLPAPNSPVVDLNQACDGDVGDLASDQRGMTRPQGTYCDTGSVERDLTPPTTPVALKPNKKFLKSRDLLFDWTDSTDPGGLGSITYDPERRRSKYDQTDFVDVVLLGGGFESERELTGILGSTECFKVVARDGDGNESPASNEKCTSTPLDDRALKKKGNWKNKKADGHYLRTYTKTKSKGAKLSLKNVEEAKRLALLATKCPNCGKVKIMLGDDLLATKSLKASSEKRNSLITLPAFNNPRSGTVKIIVQSDGKLVKIEGLGISKV